MLPRGGPRASSPGAPRTGRAGRSGRAVARVAALLPAERPPALALALILLAGRARRGCRCELGHRRASSSERSPARATALRRAAPPARGQRAGACAPSARSRIASTARLAGTGAARLDVHLRNCPRCVGARAPARSGPERAGGRARAPRPPTSPPAELSAGPSAERPADPERPPRSVTATWPSLALARPAAGGDRSWPSPRPSRARGRSAAARRGQHRAAADRGPIAAEPGGVIVGRPRPPRPACASGRWRVAHNGRAVRERARSRVPAAS